MEHGATVDGAVNLGEDMGEDSCRFRDRHPDARYRAIVVHVVNPGALGRLIPLAIVGALVAGACSLDSSAVRDTLRPLAESQVAAATPGAAPPAPSLTPVPTDTPRPAIKGEPLDEVTNAQRPKRSKQTVVRLKFSQTFQYSPKGLLYGKNPTRYY